MSYALLVAGMIVCAVLAIRATRLLTAALWLAGVSVLTAITLYLIGAREVAVIELSVGAGLVTVLFVFAIGIAGDDAMQSAMLIPRLFTWVLIALLLALLIFMILPSDNNQPAVTEPVFAAMFWEQRALDVLVQIALMFCGVLGVLGLLSEPKSPTIPPLQLSEREDRKPETFSLASSPVSQRLPEKERL